MLLQACLPGASLKRRGGVQGKMQGIHFEWLNHGQDAYTMKRKYSAVRRLSCVNAESFALSVM
jgi:hypothetical protein